MQSSGRILTVCLNPAVDITYLIDRFEPGREHDVREIVRMAGGKGNNVARVVAALGHRAVATGFSGGATGQFIERALREQGVTPEFVPAAGESRTSVTVVDTVSGTHTLLREPGPAMTEEDALRILHQFSRLIRHVDFAVISGRVPPGIPTDFYAELVSTAYRVAQVRCVVDAAGALFRESLSAQPWMVKPNLEELSEWAGRSLTTEAEILETARALHEAGPLIVAVSMGPRGMLLVSPEGTWRAVPPQVEAVNPIGSGDSLVAGFVAALLEGRSAEEILRMAVACGTANALSTGVADVDLTVVGQLVSQVRVERIT